MTKWNASKRKRPGELPEAGFDSASGNPWKPSRLFSPWFPPFSGNGPGPIIAIAWIGRGPL